MTRKKLPSSVRPAPAAIKKTNGDSTTPSTAASTKHHKSQPKGSTIMSANGNLPLRHRTGPQRKIVTARSKKVNAEATTVPELASRRRCALSCQMNRSVRNSQILKSSCGTRQDAQCRQGLDATPSICPDMPKHRGSKENAEGETAQALCHEHLSSKRRRGEAKEAQSEQCVKPLAPQADGSQSARPDNGYTSTRRHERGESANIETITGDSTAKAAKRDMCSKAATADMCITEASLGVKRKRAQDLIVQGKRKRRVPNRCAVHQHIPVISTTFRCFLRLDCDDGAGWARW